MTLVIWFLLLLFILKLIWNLGVPFVLIKRLHANPAVPTSRISMSTAVEVFLLLIATGAAAISSGTGWVNRPLVVLGWGIAAITFTYIHLAVVGAVGAWLISRKRRLTADSSPLMPYRQNPPPKK